MGSWDVSCKATHYPIHCGDRCVCIALEKRKYDNTFMGNLAKTTFIRGEYDDYSMIKPDEGQFSLGYEKFIANQECAFEHLNLLWMREDAFDKLRMPIDCKSYEYNCVEKDRKSFIQKEFQDLDQFEGEAKKSIEHSKVYSHLMEKLYENLGVTKSFVKLLENFEGDKEQLRESIADIYYVSTNLFFCNIKFEPSFRASQCGASDVNDFLLEVTQNAAEDYRKNHSKRYEE